MTMTPERWQRIEQVLRKALELDAAERTAILDHECAGDAVLRAEVESLIASARPAESFLTGNVLNDAHVLLEDAESESLLGHQIGHYLIQHQLGSGGVGEVYLAQDVSLGRNVALKLLTPALTGDGATHMRFLREARLASALDHPNICTIHEVGEAAGRLYIAMQYVAGQTLREMIAGKPLGLDRLLSISLQLADAIATAHAQGIIHRDIKPANIIVASSGQAKVLDFGLAKLLQQTDGERETGLTMTGTVMGTPASMSPEQARGEHVDHRSDIFSFGVVLYEMATGRAPFCGQSKADVISALLKDRQTPAIEINGEIPARLSALVDRALAKEPNDRYQTMIELIAGLRLVSTEVGGPGRLFNSSVADSVARNVPLRQTFVQRLARWTQTPGRGFAAALFVGIALLALILAVYYLPRRQLQPKQLSPLIIKSIAVLPFKPLVSDKRDEPLEMGMADTLIARLSNIREIDVRPISAVRGYVALEQDALAAGREQKVDAVLDGSIQKSDDRIRITVRLVSVETGATLWTDTFDDKLGDIFTVEDSISERVAGILVLRLTGEERALVAQHYTNNADAYQLYLKGRYFWNKRTGEAITKSIDYFNQALEKDPNYALAHAGLAQSYVLLAGYGERTPQQSYSKARTEATEALKMNDKLADAHSALAYIKTGYDWDFVGADSEHKRALELNPNDATVRHWYAEYLALMGGHTTESIAEMKRAQELEPLSLIINKELGTTLYLARQFDAAVEQLKKTLDLDPSFVRARIQLGAAYRQKEQYEEAVSEFRKAVESEKEESLALSQLGHTYAVSGKKKEAYKIIEQLRERAKKRHLSLIGFAQIYAGLGDKSLAFECLEKAYAERDEDLLYLRTDPLWDSLRSDPRFANLLRRIGFQQ